MSRPLPNTFALILVMIVFERLLEGRYESAVRYATASVILFRCELVLLYGPIFLGYMISGRLKVFGFDGAIAIGVRIAAMCLGKYRRNKSEYDIINFSCLHSNRFLFLGTTSLARRRSHVLQCR